MINLFIAGHKNPTPIKVKHPEAIQFIYIDLFCGAGGTSTGLLRSKIDGKQIAIVAACVNHDHKAIQSHWMNHPEVVHYEEDIRTLELSPLVKLITEYREMYPQAKIVLWASLECTNFSKAKGGQPRDADSRTLADHLDRYIDALNPDYIQIENVVEFMSWGPLDAKGKPVSRRSGADWMRWREHINSFGYRDEWKEMNSADFGAFTSRNRLFGCFAKDGLPIVWPEPTHSKKAEKNDLFGTGLRKWNAVKEVLDFEDEGNSILNRKKPLVDPSLERIYAGLVKFVAGGKDSYLLQYNSGSVENRVIDIDGPCNSIPTNNRFALAQTSFITKYYSGKPSGQIKSIDEPADALTCIDHHSVVKCKPFILNYHHSSVCNSVDVPCPTLVCRDKLAVINPSFLAKYYGKGDNVSSIEEPAGALVTKDRFSKIQAVFIEKTFSGNGNVRQIQSIDSPAGTIMPNDKHRLINCQPFILNPSHGGHCTGTETPCPVIIARQDKAPLYLIQFKVDAKVQIPVYEGDSEVMIRIKEFMALYGIADIKMRMLKVAELLPIQGFPKNYKLVGNQTDQKKFIGNSVVPHVVTSWIETLGLKLIKWQLN